MGLDSKKQGQKSKPEVIRPANLVNYETNSIASEEIVDRKATSVAVFAFDKFQEIVEHVLPYDAIFYVFEGEAEVIIKSKSYTVKNGELILVPAKTPHSVSAKSKFKMLLTTIKE